MQPSSRSNGADPDCPICGGLGYYSYNVPVGHPRFGRAYPCDCTAKHRAAQLQAICGLTCDELAARLDDVRRAGSGTAAMLKAAHEFVEQPRGMITLWGGVGNAKTLILQAVVNECLQRDIQAIYVTMLDLLEYIREAYRENKDSGERGSAWSRLERYATAHVLCIDEMDKVKITEWVIEYETALMDKRYRLGVAGQTGTILAMNADPEATLPDWIYSRLSDGRNQIIHNDDPDMRRLMR